jgi:hypothetical protein
MGDIGNCPSVDDSRCAQNHYEGDDDSCRIDLDIHSQPRGSIFRFPFHRCNALGDRLSRGGYVLGTNPKSHSWQGEMTERDTKGVRIDTVHSSDSAAKAPIAVWSSIVSPMGYFLLIHDWMRWRPCRRFIL